MQALFFTQGQADTSGMSKILEVGVCATSTSSVVRKRRGSYEDLMGRLLCQTESLYALYRCSLVGVAQTPSNRRHTVGCSKNATFWRIKALN